MRKILVSILSVLLIASCLLSVCSCSVAQTAKAVDIVLGASLDTAAEAEEALDGLVFAGAADEEIFATLPEVDTPDTNPASPGLCFKLINYGVDENGQPKQAYSVVGFDAYWLGEKEALPKEVYIPYTYEGLPVVEIAQRVFQGADITTVTLPKTLLKIGDKAFFDSKITSITLPASLLYISQEAFIGCNGLTSIATESGSARYSVNGPFLMDGSVIVRGFGEGTIGPEVTEIAPYAFKGCDAITTVTIPASVEKIGDGAFADCTKLASATIEKEITTLPRNIFDGCSSLLSVTLPESIKEYGYASFRGTAFREFTIPANVETVGNYAFADCYYLTSVTISEGVAVIGGAAFKNCIALPSIVFSKGVTTIGANVCNGCTSLSSVMIAPTVTSIGDGAFYNCARIQAIQIPKSVVTLGSVVLYGVDKTCAVSIETSYIPTGWDGAWNAYKIDNALESKKVPIVVNYLNVKRSVAPQEW